MEDDTNFSTKVIKAKNDIKQLEAIEDTQKEKRDNADQVLKEAKKQLASPEKIEELTKTASTEEFKLQLCGLVAERTAKQRDEQILERRQKSNKLLDDATIDTAKGGASPNIHADLSPNKRKFEDDNADCMESQHSAQGESMMIMQSRGLMKNSSVKKKSMSTSEKSLIIHDDNDDGNYEESNKLLDRLAMGQGSVSSNTRSELLPKQTKDNEDNAGNIESQCIAQDEPIIMMQSQSSMENSGMNDKSMPTAEQSLILPTTQKKIE